MKPGWVETILGFWFGKLQPADWFRTDAALDAKIRRRFGDLYEDIRLQSPLALGDTPQSSLAAIIALDQFPRNMFRGTARAYESDVLALALAMTAIDAGQDSRLEPIQGQFVYMPFEHSEDRSAQQRSVALFSDPALSEYLPYALEHKAIIDRFGRFPHRNAILGRTSTPEEIAFLETADSPDFGAAKPL